jgi:hypothetical protein
VSSWAPTVGSAECTRKHEPLRFLAKRRRGCPVLDIAWAMPLIGVVVLIGRRGAVAVTDDGLGSALLLKVYEECLDGHEEVQDAGCRRRWGLAYLRHDLGAYWAWTPDNCR